ncbi:MAG: hypothetical protein JW751_22530 [Polyangiaceae bacterium]|nr:hypothetical protein [Polyangiaceae bacterium]
MPLGRRRFAASGCAVAAAASLLGGAHRAVARCPTDSKYSPCLDADAHWLAPPHASFLGVPAAVPLGPPRQRVGVAFGWLERPVVMTLPGPDPAGREVSVVERLLALSLLTSHALSRRVTLDAVVPFTVTQRGLGIEGLTSLEPQPKPRVLRDPRAGISFALGNVEGPLELALATRYVMVVPLGDERTLGGERGFVGAPSFAVAARHGGLFAGAELGARLRMPTALGDSRLGTSLAASVGIGWDVLTRGRLTLTAEAIATPVLVRQRQASEDAGSPRLVPAEWLAGIGSAPFGTGRPVVSLGFGSGIPLSRPPRGFETDGPSSAVTTPHLRGVLYLRQELGRPRENTSRSATGPLSRRQR